jgi:hypothetical protein
VLSVVRVNIYEELFVLPCQDACERADRSPHYRILAEPRCVQLNQYMLRVKPASNIIVLYDTENSKFSVITLQNSCLVEQKHIV